MSKIQPFNIAVPDSQVENLHQKLSLVRFPDEVDEAGWDYGAPLADIQRLTSYWRESFSWKDAQDSMNKLPQFTTTIEIEGFDTLTLHFIHARSLIPTAIPLIFVHGCMPQNFPKRR